MHCLAFRFFNKRCKMFYILPFLSRGIPGAVVHSLFAHWFIFACAYAQEDNAICVHRKAADNALHKRLLLNKEEKHLVCRHRWRIVTSKGRPREGRAVREFPWTWSFSGIFPTVGMRNTCHHTHGHLFWFQKYKIGQFLCKCNGLLMNEKPTSENRFIRHLK